MVPGIFTADMYWLKTKSNGELYTVEYLIISINLISIAISIMFTCQRKFLKILSKCLLIHVVKEQCTCKGCTVLTQGSQHVENKLSHCIVYYNILQCRVHFALSGTYECTFRCLSNLFTL